MTSVLLNLIPLMIGSAVVPVFIITVILLLKREDGVVTAVAFVGGMTAIRLLQGVVLSVVFGRFEAAGDTERSGVIASILLLVIGIAMLVTAVRLLLGEEDPDAPPPKWMQLLDGLTPLKAFALGAGLLVIAVKHWVFLLSALGVIADADLGRSQRVIAFLAFVVGAQLLMILLILVRVLVPSRAEAALTRIGDWLQRHNRPIGIAVSAIFGSYFLWKALTGLL